MKSSVVKTTVYILTFIVIFCSCSTTEENTKKLTEEEVNRIFTDFFIKDDVVETLSLTGGSCFLFGSDTMTISDIPDEVKQLHVWYLYNLHRKLEEIEPPEELKANIDDEEACYSYPVALFNERLKALFGPDCEITHKTFADSGHVCIYDEANERYITFMYKYKNRAYEPSVYSNFSLPDWEITDWEEKGDDVYIYTKFLMYTMSNTDMENMKIYSSGWADESSYIKDIAYDYSMVFSQDYGKQFLDEYGSLYKVTFRRAEDGTYYWAGSEQITKYVAE